MYDIVQIQRRCQQFESLSQTSVQFRVRRNTTVAESLLSGSTFSDAGARMLDNVEQDTGSSAG